jgi:seryl-tRNA synthetase
LTWLKWKKRINAKLKAISNNAANEKPKENPKEDESRREIAHHEQTIQELQSKITSLTKLHNKTLEQKEQVISSLEEQITKAQNEQSTLTKQLADITQERDSLILAFSLIIDDKPSGQDYEYSCKTFKKPKRNVKNVKSTGKPADVASCVY